MIKLLLIIISSILGNDVGFSEGYILNGTDFLSLDKKNERLVFKPDSIEATIFSISPTDNDRYLIYVKGTNKAITLLEEHDLIRVRPEERLDQQFIELEHKGNGDYKFKIKNRCFEVDEGVTKELKVNECTIIQAQNFQIERPAAANAKASLSEFGPYLDGLITIAPQDQPDSFLQENRTTGRLYFDSDVINLVKIKPKQFYSGYRLDDQNQRTLTSTKSGEIRFGKTTSETDQIYNFSPISDTKTLIINTYTGDCLTLGTDQFLMSKPCDSESDDQVFTVQPFGRENEDARPFYLRLRGLSEYVTVVETKEDVKYLMGSDNKSEAVQLKTRDEVMGKRKFIEILNNGEFVSVDKNDGNLFSNQIKSDNFELRKLKNDSYEIIHNDGCVTYSVSDNHISIKPCERGFNQQFVKIFDLNKSNSEDRWLDRVFYDTKAVSMRSNGEIVRSHSRTERL